MMFIELILSSVVVLFVPQVENSKTIFNFIQSKSDIQEGGSGLFQYENTTYLITVSPVIVGTKTEGDCKKVGSTKAKRDMLSYINGSDISSYTELALTEEITETLEGKKIEVGQIYKEVIRESVLGTINEINPLGGWYSEDRSVYYFAIYKSVDK